MDRKSRWQFLLFWHEMVFKSQRNWSQQIRRISNDKSLPVIFKFRKNGCVTTKVGLSKTLKDSIWFSNVDQNEFFPKCFDLKNDDDCLNFTTEFKFTKA